MTLSASRIRPGTYTVDVDGVGRFRLSRSRGSTWEVWERTATWDRDGFRLKRDAMAYLEEVRRGVVESEEWERRKRQEELSKTDHNYVWLVGFGESLPEERGKALRAVIDEPGVYPVWLAQTKLEDGFLADLVHWRGQEEDLDVNTLHALGGEVVARGMAVPDTNGKRRKGGTKS